jgi:RNA polymerase sigma factor (sigma-70 family)
MLGLRTAINKSAPAHPETGACLGLASGTKLIRGYTYKRMTFWGKRHRPADASVKVAAEPASLLTDLDSRYRRPLVNYFEKRVREAFDVDDLVQEVFIRLTYRSELQPIENLEAYVFQVAHNVIRDRLRRRATHRVAQHDTLENSPELTDDFSPERVLIGRQLLTRAIESLEELPARTRHVFVLCQYEEMSLEDIAAQLGLSVSGVRFLLRQAKAHLARRMESDT